MGGIQLLKVLYLTIRYYLEVLDIPTHRTSLEVDKRMEKYLIDRHKEAENANVFNGITFNDCLDELLKEVGY